MEHGIFCREKTKISNRRGLGVFMGDFINELLMEWSYHVVNIIIILFFSIYGCFITFKKKTKDIDIRVFFSKFDLKEFLKYFFILFVIYIAYILWRNSN